MKFKCLVQCILAGLTITLAATVAASTMQDAQQAIDKQDYPSAIIHLKNQLKKSPKDAQARFLLGDTYLKSGNLAASLKELGRANNLAPDNTDILFRYVEALQLSANHNKVMELLKKPLADKQHEILRLNYLANVHLSRKQLGDAKALYEQANELSPNSMAYNGLASLAIIENDLTLAKQLLDKSSAIDAENPTTLQINAKLANINKHHEAALELYNQLLAKNPENLSYHLERASTLAILKKYELAKADLKVVLDKFKNHPQANFIKAQILLIQKDFAGAQKAAQNAVSIAPQHMPATFILGAASLALKQYNQAEEYLTIYLASDPDNFKAQNVLANVYLAQNKTKQSLLILEGIPKKQFDIDPMLMLTLGSNYIQAGDTKKGLEILARAQSLAPENQEIRRRIIAAQFQSGEFKDAINELEQLSSFQNDATKVQTNYLLIISYIKQKQFDAAEEKVKQLLIKTPDDTNLLNLQALIEQLKGNTDKAIAQYQVIIKNNKKNIPAYMGLARIYALEKNWNQAEQSFKQVIEIEPKAVKAYLGLAAVAIKQNQSDIAEQYFWQALKQSKNDIPVTLTIAGVFSKWYQSKKQPEKILALAEKLDQQTPNNKLIRSFLAQAQLNSKQTEHAERTLKSIIRLDKNDINHRILLARVIAQDSQRIPEALSILDNAQAVQAENVSIYTLKASLLIKQNEYDKAINLAQAMQENFPDKTNGKLLEADIHRSQKHYEKALLIYQDVYKQQSDKKVFSAIIDMLIALNQKDKAITLLTEELASTPDNTENLFKLASLHQEKQQLQEAEKYYQLLLKQNPKHIVSLNNLAWIKIDSDVKEAVKLAKTAYEQAPQSAAIMDSYGYFLVKDGQTAEGIMLLKQAATKLPKDKDIKYHLALAYEQSGERQTAQSILKTIVNSNDDFLEKEKAQSLYNSIK